MAPTGKFEPSKLNPPYFIWTKLAIGIVFGVLLAIIYETLPLSRRIDGPRMGVKYAFWLWVVVYSGTARTPGSTSILRSAISSSG